MSNELIESRWREVSDTISSIRDLKHLLTQCISLATEYGYNVSEISHALHWQVEEALYDYDVGCVLPDKQSEYMTNRDRLSRLPLEELLGIISDSQDQCVIYSIGDRDAFELNDCIPANCETLTEHCRKCIAKWLNERSDTNV